MLSFRFEPTDGVPASVRLVAEVKRAVLGGELAPGSRFPSVRTVARDLEMSPTTVHKAMRELRTAGILSSRPGRGLVVAAQPDRAARLAHLGPLCDALLDEASRIGLGPDDAVEALRNRMAGHHP